MEEATSQMFQRVVVVSHLLPIKLSKNAASGEWSACWDEQIARPETAISRYSALGVRGLDTPCLFVGSPNVFVPEAERPVVEAAIEAAGISAAVVYVEKSVASRFYQGYCKSTLWPILHNVIDVYNSTQVTHAIVDEDGESAGASCTSGPGSPQAGRRISPAAAGEPENWQAPRSWNPIEAAEKCWPDYCRANRAVAAAVVENFQEGDLIWIHHYHLMLLPSELARKLRNSANIGAQRAHRHRPRRRRRRSPRRRRSRCRPCLLTPAAAEHASRVAHLLTRRLRRRDSAGHIQSAGFSGWRRTSHRQPIRSCLAHPLPLALSSMFCSSPASARASRAHLIHS